MDNAKELREELIKVFTAVKSGKMELENAKILITTANAIINSAHAQLEYNKFTGVMSEIPFLEEPVKKLR